MGIMVLVSRDSVIKEVLGGPEGLLAAPQLWHTDTCS